jgi:ADP-ribosylglycohydrolase
MGMFYPATISTIYQWGFTMKRKEIFSRDFAWYRGGSGEKRSQEWGTFSHCGTLPKVAEDVHAPYGAIIGDICGSIYEFDNWKTKNPSEIELINPKCFFTDDTVLTVAVADALGTDWDYGRAIRNWAEKYPNSGYGGRFALWLQSDTSEPYGSWGNGSAMRVSPIGWLLEPNADGFSNESALREYCIQITAYEATCSAKVTHNHPEGIKGAQAVALAILFARAGESKESIRRQLSSGVCSYSRGIIAKFDYDLTQTLDKLRPKYKFDESCRGTVPAALIAFFESHDYVSAIQNAISIGGDSDTIACITGSIAEAFYGEIPQELIDFAKSKLPDEMIAVIEGTDPRFTGYCTDRDQFYSECQREYQEAKRVKKQVRLENKRIQAERIRAKQLAKQLAAEQAEQLK